MRYELELVDGLPEKSWNLSEVMRYIQISLLSMQQHPEDKPSMASVVLTSGGESVLPKPKEPGFFKYRGLVEANSSSGQADHLQIMKRQPHCWRLGS